MVQMTAPLVTAAPPPADSPETVPALCAVIGCSIFIASSTTIRSPASTLAPFSTATLTIVPCIGEGRASPGGGAPPCPDPPLGGLAAAPGAALPPAARPAGREASSRRPPTSTTTV